MSTPAPPPPTTPSATAPPSRPAAANFGALVYQTPLTPTVPATHALASHCVRQAFGPAVQLVADALLRRGVATLPQLVAYLQQHAVVQRHRRPTHRGAWLAGGGSSSNMASGAKPTVQASTQAALMVLLQHGLVEATPVASRTTTAHHYRLVVDRCNWLPRYSRLVDYVQRATASAPTTASHNRCVVLWESLLMAGRLDTQALLEMALKRQESTTDDNERKHLVDSLDRLVQGGWIVEATPLPTTVVLMDDDDDDVVAFAPPPPKRVKREADDWDASWPRPAHPIDWKAVWCVQLDLVHAHWRAFSLGRLVAELYGHCGVTSAGSLVTAALKHVATTPTTTVFTATHVHDDTSWTRHLPRPVRQSLEQGGGLALQASRAWKALAAHQQPVPVVYAHGSDQYQIATQRLVAYLRDRCVHQFVVSRHGVVAARLLQILRHHGWLESDWMADRAMVPAKEARTILHALHQDSLVEVIPVGGSSKGASSGGNGSAASLYLWKMDPHKVLVRVREQVTRAMWQLRLRRQHQVEICGKEWMERAATVESSGADENIDETDQLNYQRFCAGLERLDWGLLQLDETLMLLNDY